MHWSSGRQRFRGDLTRNARCAQARRRAAIHLQPMKHPPAGRETGSSCTLQAKTRLQCSNQTTRHPAPTDEASVEQGGEPGPNSKVDGAIIETILVKLILDFLFGTDVFLQILDCSGEPSKSKADTSKPTSWQHQQNSVFLDFTLIQCGSVGKFCALEDQALIVGRYWNGGLNEVLHGLNVCRRFYLDHVFIACEGLDEDPHLHPTRRRMAKQ